MFVSIRRIVLGVCGQSKGCPDCLLRGFYTILTGTQEVVNRGDGDKDYHWAITPKEQLSAADVTQVKLRLADLAEHVRFRRHVAGKRFKGGTEVGAKIVPDTTSQGPKPGRTSTISYSEDLYQDLVRFHDRPADRRFKTAVRHGDLEAIMHFATIVLHELEHAGWIARQGYIAEPHIGDCPIAELGFDLEASVWGGLVIIDPLSNRLAMHDWPDPRRRAVYLHQISCSSSNGTMTDVNREWVIPHAWVRQLFLDTFWDKIVPFVGADAAKAPRVLGLSHVVTPCRCRSNVDEKVSWIVRPDGLREGVANEHPDCEGGIAKAYKPNGPDFQDRCWEDSTLDGLSMHPDGTMLSAELVPLVKISCELDESSSTESSDEGG